MPRKPKEPTAVPLTLPTQQGIIEGIEAGAYPELEPYGTPDVPMSQEALDKAIALKNGKRRKAKPVVEDIEDDISEGLAEDDSPLLKAAQSNDRRQLLIAMRDRLAYMLDKIDSGRDVAAIARNLNIVSKELDSMPDPDAADNDPVEQMRKKVAGRQKQ